MQQTRSSLFRPSLTGLSLFALAAVSFVPALHAGDPGQPARAVRLGAVDGQVTLSENGQLVANPALINTPVFEGAELATGSDGRAELQFDDGSVARISPDGALLLPVLNPSGEAQLQLNRGLAYFELQGGAASPPISIHFGDATVTASGFTVLRVRFDTPPGELAVFSGNVHLERPGGLALDLHGGESIRLDPANPAHYTLAESIEPDSWDTWNSDRDEALTASAADRTGAASSLPNASAPAWNDLDNYGTWYNLSGRGYIWSPYEGASSGWDPWGNGHWLWTPRYGYIWVSGDPWGYMPFACGAWDYYDSFGWGWMPGNCNPWWGGGFWVSTYFEGGPGGFRFPRRPRIGPPGGYPPGGHRPVQPTFVINRRPISGPLVGQSHRHDGPIEVGGITAQPLRPLPRRPQYDHRTGSTVQVQSPSWGSYRAPSQGAHSTLARPSSPQQGFQSGAARPNYQTLPQNNPSPSRPGGLPRIFGGGGSGSHPAPSGGGAGSGAHPTSGSGSRVNSGGGGGSQPSSGGGSRVSSGGGGGGASSHPSSTGPHK